MYEKFKINATTDNNHIGEGFKYKNNILTFEDSSYIDIIRVIENNYSYVFVAENYIIEAIEEVDIPEPSEITYTLELSEFKEMDDETYRIMKEQLF